MGQVLGIVYRAIVGHLINKAGFTRKPARTGAMTLIQRFGVAGAVYVTCRYAENQLNTRLRSPGRRSTNVRKWLTPAVPGWRR